MPLNIDFSQRLVIDTHSLDWTPSPEFGVERRLLEREGGETGRATSIVRYDPGAGFPSHVHAGGEEIFVLEGTLTDEAGTYLAGSYLRNPPGSFHAPFSDEGCLLMVKRGHMKAEEMGTPLVVSTRQGEWVERGKGRPQRMALFTGTAAKDSATPPISVGLVRFAPGDRVENDLHAGGEEVMVLEGVLEDEYGLYPQGTWLRQPDGSRHAPFSTEGCLLLVWRGHLSD